MRTIRWSSLGGGIAAIVALSGCAERLPLATDTPIPVEQAVATIDDGPAGVESARGRLFFPLDVGNHWDYEHVFRYQIDPDDGPPEPPGEVTASVAIDLTGTVVQDGREYVVWRERYVDESQTFEQEFIYRQDRTGLYNLDLIHATIDRVELAEHRARVAGAYRLDAETRHRRALASAAEKHALIRNLVTPEPASASPRRQGAVPPSEITLLSYPLHAGKSWHVRENPLVIYTVERMESLRLPAGRFNGWRIRIDWPGVFGPNDRAHVWYGREGFLKLEARLETIETDLEGNRYGVVRSHEVQVLSDLDLVERPRGTRLDP